MTYSWSNGGTDLCTSVSASIGSTCFNFTVSDPYEATSEDEVCINVSELNADPVAGFDFL